MLSLHLLGLVERRDIWSVRDLRKQHIAWLKHMREKFLDAAVKLYPDIERDQLKLYMHCEHTRPSPPSLLFPLPEFEIKFELTPSQISQHITIFMSTSSMFGLSKE